MPVVVSVLLIQTSVDVHEAGMTPKGGPVEGCLHLLLYGCGPVHTDPTNVQVEKAPVQAPTAREMSRLSLGVKKEEKGEK